LKKYGFDLIDGELLADKLKELGLGVKTKTVEAVEIDENGFSSLRPREVHEHEQLRDFVWATRA
jgi:hypothetical protein